MWTPSLITYLHFMAFGGLSITICMALVLLKPKMTIIQLNRIRKIDRWFGFSALISLGTGLLKLFYFDKGLAYYNANSIFTVKYILFILVGLLSIYPTIQFLKYKSSNQAEVILKHYRALIIIMRLELICIAGIPLLGVLMANGFGI